jgi:hypothetical protein
MSNPGVGQDIEDICTRCGDTWHVVMAKLGDRVVKVVCKLCGSQHNYRGENNQPEGGSGTSGSSSWGASRRRRSAKRPSAAAPPVTPSFDPSRPPRAYSVKDGYATGERMIHPTFGTGVVAGSPGPGKVEVVFPSGARTLACAKAESTLERPIAAVHVPIADRPPDKPPDGDGNHN